MGWVEDRAGGVRDGAAHKIRASEEGSMVWILVEEDMEMYLAMLNVTCLGDILTEVTL